MLTRRDLENSQPIPIVYNKKGYSGENTKGMAKRHFDNIS